MFSQSKLKMYFVSVKCGCQFYDVLYRTTVIKLSFFLSYFRNYHCADTINHSPRQSNRLAKSSLCHCTRLVYYMLFWILHCHTFAICWSSLLHKGIYTIYVCIYRLSSIYAVNVGTPKKPTEAKTT